MKRLNKIITIVLFAFIVLPNIINAELFPKSRYRTKGWWYFKRLEGGAGLPPYVYGSILSVGAGFSPPFGFGAGITFAEATGPFTLIVHSDVEEESDTLSEIFWGELPISLFWVPWLHIPNPDSLKFTVLYLFFRASILRQIIGEPYEEYRLWHLRGGIGLEHSFLPFWLNLGIEAGYRWLSFDYKVGIAQSSSPYVALTLFVGSWGPIKVHTLPSPSLHLFASFYDADGNNVLSDNEEGKLVVTISNKGKGKAKDTRLTFSILEEEFRDKIFCENYYSIGDIEPMEQKKVEVKIKAKTELPRGKFNIMITSHYKTEWNEEDKNTETYTINTMPLIGMFRVHFENVSPKGLPEWIIPTPLNYADYKVSYTENNLVILNLNTGERKVMRVSSSEVQNYIKNYFLSWDRENPSITLSSDGGTVRAETLRLFARLYDDRKIDEMEVYLNGKLYKSKRFVERTEVEEELLIPLIMGDNEIRITLTDWVGKRDEKRIIFTRIRGGTGITTTGRLPPGAPPPILEVSASPIDGNNTIVGGKEEGIRVSVRNRGQGIAKWVRVILEGDTFLTQIWGKERNLEDIRPGEEKTATFSILMPMEMERREAKINVVIKEGRGYSPKEKPSLNFTLVPVEKKEREVELIEDVDHGIPEGKTKRERGYALIIGVSKYSNVSAPTNYAKNDAEAFSKYANKVFGIPQENIVTLYDERATLGGIKGKLIDWLKEKKGFKIIYFAGHGVPDPQNPREGDVFLLPYDGDPESKSTLISVQEIASLGAWKNNPTSDTILVFLDACFSGGEGRSPQLASRPITVAEIKTTNAIIFAAAEGTHPAKEFKEAKHGYFTYYLLLGLKGKAVNRDGWITTTSLYNFVKEKVLEKTNNIQKPVLKPEREIKIAKMR